MSASARLRPRYAPGLETYLSDIDRAALLSPREEREFAARIARGEAGARDRMIWANLRLVVHIAKEYRGRGLPLEDLVAEGNLGLIRAVGDFDGREGVRFSTYASYWIKNAIRDALSNRAAIIRLPVHAGQLLVKWRRTAARLGRVLGRKPSFDEVAGAMGLPEGKRRIVAQALRTRHCCAPDEMPDEPAAPPAEPGHAEWGEEIRHRLGRLDATERSVIVLHYGLGGGEPLTLKEVGQRFGHTGDWVCKIEARALAKLRHRLPRITGSLSVQSDQDDRDERDRHDQHPRPGEASACEDPSRVDFRGGRRPAAAPSTRELPGQPRSHRDLQLLRRGETGRPSAHDRLRPPGPGRYEDRPDLQHPRAAESRPTTSSGRSTAGRSPSTANGRRPAPSAMSKISKTV
jgi:RNA polymerase primary sigma factor